jgi:GTPase SAR1 family protein
MTSAYYRGIAACMFVYDVTDRRSYEAVQTVWLDDLERFNPNSLVARILIAAKVRACIILIIGIITAE